MICCLPPTVAFICMFVICIFVFLYFCIFVFLYFCIFVFSYFCIFVFLYFYIFVFLYFGIFVFLEEILNGFEIVELRFGFQLVFPDRIYIVNFEEFGPLCRIHQIHVIIVGLDTHLFT